MPNEDRDEELEITEARELLGRFTDKSSEEPVRDLTGDILHKLPQDAWESDARVDGSHWWLARVAAVIVIALILWQRMADPPEYDSETVSKALGWLVSAQESSGDWDPEKWNGQEDLRVGLTSLATLALLGSDEDPMNGPRSDAIERGVDYLASQQNETGRFGPGCSNIMYNHGLATVALLEAYAITGNEKLRASVDDAISFIRSAQTAEGGWGYLGLPAEEPNTSVSVWPLHALLMAQGMGWDNVDESSASGMAWLRSVTDKDGLVGYTAQGDFPNGPATLTAMGMFYGSLAGTSPSSADGGRQLELMLPEGSGYVDFYHWYFLANALHTTSKDQRIRGTGKIEALLAERQIMAGSNAGSWDPVDQWSSAGGRVYSTAMAALSLESDLRVPRTTGWMKGSR